jgi:hypothetical protein
MIRSLRSHASGDYREDSLGCYPVCPDGNRHNVSVPREVVSREVALRAVVSCAVVPREVALRAVVPCAVVPCAVVPRAVALGAVALLMEGCRLSLRAAGSQAPADREAAVCCIPA